MILFPTRDEALELHRYLIGRFGGSHGVRDLGLLESALFRPQTGYYKDIISMASAMMESLLLNHPFVDGNKRVAFFLTDVFLRTNGFKIKIRPQAGHQFLLSVLEVKEDRFEKINGWLRKHIRDFHAT